MNIGIRDVAASAGVSATTVSHVLNVVSCARISPETWDKVRSVAELLGYGPDRLAQALLQRRVDGILYPGMYHRNVELPANLGSMPSVLVDSVASGGSITAVGALLGAAATPGWATSTTPMTSPPRVGGPGPSGQC